MSASKRKTQGSAMATEDRLGRLLERLSSDPEALAAERQSLPQSAEARLQFLLREIDETVLPRHLDLLAGGKRVARLTVSNRRLIDIDTPGRASASDDPQAMAEVFAETLTKLARIAGDISLQVTRRTALPSHPEAACSVHTLEQLLGIEPSHIPFERLCRQIEAKALSQLVWANGSDTLTGAPEWVPALRDIATRYRAMHSKPRKAPRIRPMRTEGIAVPLSDDLIIAIVSLAENGLAAVLPRAEGLALIAAWQHPA